jgi:hypothetical protein
MSFGISNEVFSLTITVLTSMGFMSGYKLISPSVNATQLRLHSITPVFPPAATFSVGI